MSLLTQPTPGQRAAEAIREAEEMLTDPSKAEYHQRLAVAIDNMQRELDFWASLREQGREQHG